MWEGKGNGEGRQGTQDTGNGLKTEGRCKCTGTPTFGLPPVFSGSVTVFMACVYAVLNPMVYMLNYGGYYSNHATNSRTHGGRDAEKVVAGWGGTGIPN